jgi:very-short-patch-repair endonuclease
MSVWGRMGHNNIVFRAGLTAALALGGFIFPPLFLMAALVGWALFSDLIKPAEPDPDEWFARRWTATADDPEWQSYYLPFCESPAETAFLAAVINFYGLRPDKGALRGSSLTLNLQVKIPPYRVDFLANDWLVIEIDGAAYHSSPEAIASDQERDRFLEEKGYSVLRIPAKIALTSPDEAMSQVERAKAVGRRPKADSTTNAKSLTSPNALTSVMKAAKSVDNFVTHINDHVKIERAIQQATSRSRLIFDQERNAIDSSLECAIRSVALSERREKDEEFNNQYEATYKRLAALFEDEKSLTKLTIPPITAPPAHPDPKINEAIQRAHDDLMDERIAYFEVIRDRLGDDRRLPLLMRSRLEGWGCLNCWAAIAP